MAYGPPSGLKNKRPAATCWELELVYTGVRWQLEEGVGTRPRTKGFVEVGRCLLQPTVNDLARGELVVARVVL